MLRDIELEKLVEPLLEWFCEHARVLPWREEPTPYRVWVSEIMLQQTRVEAVKPYFERFTKELPDVAALASCPEDKLLKLWEGLGYYNRVRNLQKAAIQVMTDYGGVMPEDYEELLKLSGIGHYTAGAVSSIAYGRYVPAVDGNVLRILTRVTADDTDIMKQSFRSEVEKELSVMMEGLTIPDNLKKKLRDENVPGALNQAMMELGATVCVPNGAPLCGECPWKNVCQTREQGRTGELPVKSKAKARRLEKRTVLILRDGEKVAIRRRPDTGLLAGLYELPNVEGELDTSQVLELVKQMDYAPIRIQKLENARHIFSHIEWQMSAYAVLVEEADMHRIEEAEQSTEARTHGVSAGEGSSLIFVDAVDASECYAIPSAFAAYAKYLNIKLGNEKFEKKI